MKKYFAILGLLGLLTPLKLSANETSSEQEETPTVIVVTGTLSEKPLSESPVPISVIDEQTIEETGAQRLDDLLKNIPGLQLNDQHGQQGQTIMMQGMDAQHVLILVDGIPVSQTGLAINVERLSVGNIERVEVVPGSSSALYGSRAMGGVINLITKSAQQSYRKAELKIVQSEIYTERLPTEVHANLTAGHAFGSGFVNQAFNATQYSGVNTTPQTFEEKIAGGYRWSLNESYERNALTATFNASGGALNRPYLQQQGPNEFERIKHENSLELAANLKHTTDRGEQLIQIEADTYTSKQDLVSTTDTSDFVRTARSASVRASAHKYGHLDSHKVVFGLVVSAQSLDQQKKELDVTVAEVDQASRTGLEAFAQDDWVLSNSIEIISGMRGQWDSGFGINLAPKIAARWDAFEGDTADVFLRSSVGIGYRAPNLKERFYLFDHSQHGYEVIGNEYVQPETALNAQLEMGGHVALGFELLNWNINIFRQDVSNLITTELDSTINNGIDSYVYNNIGEARIQGVDASVGFPLAFFDHQLEHSFSIQRLDAKNLRTKEPLDNRPDTTIKATQRLELALPFSPILNTQFRHTGSQFVNGELASAYNQWDSQLQLSLSEAWQFLLGASNLNNNYNRNTANDVRPALGRTWHVTLRFNQH